MTMASKTNRRKAAAQTGVYLGVVAAIAVVVNVGVAISPTRFDLTTEKRYTLSTGSGNLVRSLKTPLDVDFYVTKGDPLLNSFVTEMTDLLGEYERKMIDYRKQQEELAKQHKHMVWKVPPIKYERLIWHELTHIFQGEVKTPDWFHEGLASWMGDDICYILDFLVAGKEVMDIDEPLAAGDDAYPRGMMFMKWLEEKAGREGMKKIMKAVYTDGADWKKALCDGTKLEWASLKKVELEASKKLAEKNRPREKK